MFDFNGMKAINKLPATERGVSELLSGGRKASDSAHIAARLLAADGGHRSFSVCAHNADVFDIDRLTSNIH